MGRGRDKVEVEKKGKVIGLCGPIFGNLIQFIFRVSKRYKFEVNLVPNDST